MYPCGASNGLAGPSGTVASWMGTMGGVIAAGRETGGSRSVCRSERADCSSASSMRRSVLDASVLDTNAWWEGGHVVKMSLFRTLHDGSQSRVLFLLGTDTDVWLLGTIHPLSTG